MKGKIPGVLTFFGENGEEVVFKCSFADNENRFKCSSCRELSTMFNCDGLCLLCSKMIHIISSSAKIKEIFWNEV